MLSLEKMSSLEIGRAVNTKEITAVQVIEYFEKRIKEYNSKYNAFVFTDFDYAKNKAKEIDERISKGEDVGIFAGVPFALKNFLSSKKGYYNDRGGVKCLKQLDLEDSPFCEALEGQGGIFIGKTNSPAFGFRGTTDNLLYGPTRNPYNINYNAGGSSGGSAAAVAAGLVPIAEGGDAGGSIRIPSSWCNLVGFIASAGVIPHIQRPDAYAASHPFCIPGGLVKSVAEAKVLFEFMKNYNNRDPNSTEIEVNIDKPRLCFTTNFNLFPTDKKIIKRLKEVISRLSDNISEYRFTFNHSAREIAQMWCKAISIDTTLEIDDMISSGNDVFKNHKEDFPKEFVDYYYEVKKMNYRDYYKYNLVKTDLYDNFTRMFEKYDFILCPVTSCMPVLNSNDRNTVGPSDVEPLIGFSETFLVNFLGLPAISIPAGFIDGLPVGIQIIGKKYSDRSLLAFAEQIEKTTCFNNMDILK